MPLPSGSFSQQGGPTCFDKMKTGFTIGFCVGMASGALFGGFQHSGELAKVAISLRRMTQASVFWDYVIAG